MLDAIIISDYGTDTFATSSSMRLQLSGKVALIQNIRNYLENNGRIIEPICGSNGPNWHSAMKLNGIILYDVLSKHGFKTEIIDTYANERDEFIQLLEKQPKAVIISTTFIISKKELAKLVRDIRSLNSDVTIICGGPFVYASYLLLQKRGDPYYDTDSPKEDFLFLDDSEPLGVDLFVVDRHGEGILIDVMNMLRDGKPLVDLYNTARWGGTDYVFSARIESKPQKNIVDWARMPTKIFMPGVVNMQASMGCPYLCQFCNFIKDQKSTMLKPVDALLEELRAVAKRGIEYVRFVDDNFRLGNFDLDSVCQEIIAANLGIKWLSFIRASTLDRTDIGLLKNAGCIEAQIGIESIDENILKNMHKGTSPDMYRRVVRKLLEHGINCSCCFIFGFPRRNGAIDSEHHQFY